MSVPVAALLGFAVWTLLLLMVGVGVRRWTQILCGRAQLSSFQGDEIHGSPAYRRAVRAHANCVENLPVFGAVVVAVELTRSGSPLADRLAIAVLAARVLQSLTHLASGGNAAVGLRFAFFLIQLLALLALAALPVLGG